MSRPASRSELLERMVSEFVDLIEVVEAMEPADRERPGACEEWSVKDLLAHIDAWHGMFLAWERAGSAGEKPEMPAPGFTWKDTPALNADIHRRHRDDSYREVSGRLTASHEAVRRVIESYGGNDLFEKKRYAWTGSTSVGSYAVSATTSHYDWARGLIRRFLKNRD